MANTVLFASIHILKMLIIFAGLFLGHLPSYRQVKTSIVCMCVCVCVCVCVCEGCVLVGVHQLKRRINMELWLNWPGTTCAVKQI